MGSVVVVIKDDVYTFLTIYIYLQKISEKSLDEWTISTSWFFTIAGIFLALGRLVLTSAEWMLKSENIREIFCRFVRQNWPRVETQASKNGNRKREK